MALAPVALTVAPPKVVPLLLITITTIFTATIGSKMVAAQGGTTWCVARSDASDQALQTALDYACGAGADCPPIQSDGLCYLPNTIQAHASFAFNSLYQRKARAPGSCNFAGTSTIAQTDPSTPHFSIFFQFFFNIYMLLCTSYIYVNVHFILILFFSLVCIGYGSCAYPSSARYVLLLLLLYIFHSD